MGSRRAGLAPAAAPSAPRRLLATGAAGGVRRTRTLLVAVAHVSAASKVFEAHSLGYGECKPASA
jgi:hypothetical protein